MSKEDAIIYTRDMPIWWLEQEAIFVGYRKKRVVIDVLQDTKGKPRRIVDLTTIRPRVQKGQQEE